MRLIFTLIFVLISISCHASTAVLLRSGAGSPACSTPTTGNTLNEGFLGAGYEGTWVESVGTNGTIDEDHTLTGSPLTGSCSEGLLTSVTTGNGGAISYTYWDNGSAITQATNDIDIYAQIRINSATLPANFDEISILHWDDSSSPLNFSGGCSHVTLYSPSGTPVLRARGTTNSDYAETSISTGTWYTIQLHLDGSGTDFFKLDSGAEKSFTEKTADCRYLHLGPSSLVDDDEAVEIEWGYVWITVTAE